MTEGEKLITSNRKARHEYHIEDSIEAGIVLTGTEVKSLREGHANLQDAYCSVQSGEMMLLNCHISPYSHGNQMNHDPLRPRKLLMHRKEIERWGRAAAEKGYTLIPLKLYFKNGHAKVEVGLARGKKTYDKRADIAERESKRRLDRVMRQY
ncbi:MAG TPA: SsrA-binding protein SmpB [Rhodothermales bacterium]